MEDLKRAKVLESFQVGICLKCCGQTQRQHGYKQIINITFYNHHLCASGGCIIPDQSRTENAKPTTAVNDHSGESVGTVPTSPFADEHAYEVLTRKIMVATAIKNIKLHQ